MTALLHGWRNHFRTGNTGREFNRMDSFVVKSLRPAGRGRQEAMRDGFVPVDGHDEIPGESLTRKITVKPCTGRRHARYGRGN
ncbi:MAG: hypothetical protein EXQ52_14155 [Bryobacterales bacterium]|nr:hypothetical protein [Bryobacterales bacterium]